MAGEVSGESAPDALIHEEEAQQDVEQQPARSFPVAFHNPSFRAGALTLTFGRNQRDMPSNQTPQNQGYEERVSCWIPPDGGAIHVKVVTIPHHDPVEMGAEQAREFAAELLKLADELGNE